MKKLFLLIVFVPLLNYGQKQGNIWYFGNHAGVDFNSGSPVALLDGQTYYCNLPFEQLTEGASVISDSSGSLLFYSNGETIWDRNHQVMPNGSGLMGNNSSTQSCLIVPVPKSSRYFCVFTTDAFACGGTLGNGIRYSIVDICANNGYGDVLAGKKNILLQDSVCEKLAACQHANGNDYWILAHRINSNQFFAFLLTQYGVTDTIITAIGSPHTGIYHAQGQMKFSPNGQRIAVGVSDAIIGLHDGVEKLEIFDFDRNNGMITNFKSLYRPYSNNMSVYGVEFSPNNSILYACGMPAYGTMQNYLFQYNLNAGGGNIDSINSSLYNVIVAGGMGQYFGLQLGPDNKIYMIDFFNLSFLAVINNPNFYGAACNYQLQAVSLAGKNGSYTLPGFVAGYYYSNKIYHCGDGVEELFPNQNINISPNPFSHSTLITLNQTYQNITLGIYNLQGQKVAEHQYADCSEINLQRGGLAEGMYFLKLTLDGKMVETRKIVISE